MEGKAKKPSLFKQRVAAVKSGIIGGSFPKAVKIVSTETQPQFSTSLEQTSKNVEQKFEKTLVDMIKDQSLLQGDDVNRISQQNLATVQGMSEKQRQDMVKQINSQLNKGFLDKLKKNSIKQQIPINSSSVSQTKPQKKEQVEETQQNNDSWEHSLKINIQTGKLCYTESSQDTLVGIAQITEMIGSDNNQSQVVGSNLAKKFVNELISTATAKSRELIIINYVPLHLSIIFQRLSYLFFEPMMKRSLKTSFVSVYMQIIQIIPQILTKIHKYISKNYRQTFSRQLKKLSETVKTFQNDEQKVQQLKTTLDVIYNLLRQERNKAEDEDWKCMKEHSDILIQLILIQQAEKGYFNSYAFNIHEFVQKSSDLTEIIEVQSFVYEIVNKFILRKTKQLYLNLDNFRNNWMPIIEIITAKMISKIVNIQLQVIFQLIFLARFVGDLTWERILSSVNQLALIKRMITHFVLFNTLSDQKSAGLREQNLESLNQVFNWLANVLSQKSSKLNPTYVTNTLLELFLQEEEYYSELDQSILQKLITSIATNQQTNFDVIFNQEKVKALIKNYGYNSFGNQVFTNLLFFIAIKCSADLQALILREVMASYTSNFIGSASRLNVDLPAIQGKKISSNQQIKSEIIQYLNKQSEKNIFFTYLSP